jgi:hypothetical protein
MIVRDTPSDGLQKSQPQQRTNDYIVSRPTTTTWLHRYTLRRKHGARFPHPHIKAEGSDPLILSSRTRGRAAGRWTSPAPRCANRLAQGGPWAHYLVAPAGAKKSSPATLFCCLVVAGNCRQELQTIETYGERLATNGNMNGGRKER